MVIFRQPYLVNGDFSRKKWRFFKNSSGNTDTPANTKQDLKKRIFKSLKLEEYRKVFPFKLLNHPEFR